MSDKLRNLKKYIEEVKNMPIKKSEDHEDYCEQFMETSSQISNIKDNSGLLSDYSGFILRENIEQLEYGLGRSNIPPSKHIPSSNNSKKVQKKEGENILGNGNMNEFNSNNHLNEFEDNAGFNNLEMGKEPEMDVGMRNFNKGDFGEELGFTEIRRKESIPAKENFENMNEEKKENNQTQKSLEAIPLVENDDKQIDTPAKPQIMKRIDTPIDYLDPFEKKDKVLPDLAEKILPPLTPKMKIPTLSKPRAMPQRVIRKPKPILRKPFPMPVMPIAKLEIEEEDIKDEPKIDEKIKQKSKEIPKQEIQEAISKSEPENTKINDLNLNQNNNTPFTSKGVISKEKPGLINPPITKNNFKFINEENFEKKKNINSVGMLDELLNFFEKSENEESKNYIKELESKLKNKEETIVKLNEENINLKTKIYNQKYIIEDLQQKLYEYKEKLNNRENKITKMNKKVENQTKKNKELMKTIEKMEQNLKEIEKNVENKYNEYLEVQKKQENVVKEEEKKLKEKLNEVEQFTKIKWNEQFENVNKIIEGDIGILQKKLDNGIDKMINEYSEGISKIKQVIPMPISRKDQANSAKMAPMMIQQETQISQKESDKPKMTNAVSMQTEPIQKNSEKISSQSSAKKKKNVNMYKK